MGKYNYEVETKLRCFKCGSTKITNLFKSTDDPLLKLNRKTGKLESVESENYNIHYDCLICDDCKTWDFPDIDLWEEVYLVSGHKCECGNTKFKFIYNDILADTFEVKCLKCEKEYCLPKESCENEFEL